MATFKQFRLNFDAIPVIDAVAYSTGDSLGAQLELTNTFGSADQSGILKQIIVIDKAKQNADMDFIIFQSAVATGTNNTTFAPTDAEMLDCVGYASIASADYADLDVNSVAVSSPNLEMQLIQNTSLFIQPVVRGTPTYAVGDLKFKFIIEADSRNSGI